jgi:formylglycine-generating enzyme required for sulfatase activity
MARIFVSYSRADRQFADEFVSLLRRVYGHDSLWFDDDIHGGADWWRLILQQVTDCELFIYLISNDALQSPYCQAEFREALRLHKQVLPVIARPKTQYPGSMPDDLATSLLRTQYVDMARGFKDHHAMSALYAAVNQLLQLDPTLALQPLWAQPTEQPPVSDKKQKRRLSKRWVIIIAVVIVSLVGSITALIALNPSAGSSTPTGAPTVVNTPAFTSDRTASATSFNGSNDDWMPVIREFDGVAMALVPAGCFMMGSENEYPDERPAHEVCFDEPFWIDQTEVTNEQFAAFNGQAAYNSYFRGDNRPREQISWLEAQTFCESRGARLPTEAEWEYAARGLDELAYPWGNNFTPDNTVWSENSGGASVDVGSKPTGVSWVGALDMSGNVWEWVADWYAESYYASLADGAVNPTGPVSGDERVQRGGSWWLGAPNDFRAAYRGKFEPEVRVYDFGFRCARSATDA